MKKREKKRLRTLTKLKRLGLGRKLERMSDFREREREREIEIFEKWQNRVGPQTIYKKCSSIDWGGIEGKKSWLIEEGIEVLSSKQRLQGNRLDGSGYLSRSIEQKPRNLDRRACIEEVSRRYRGGTNKSPNRLSAAENKLDTVICWQMGKISQGKNATGWF